jgi:hypothetical protein
MRQNFYFLSILCALQFFGCVARGARQSSHPFISGDTFRAIANHIIDETHQPFSPEKVKPRDIIFLKKDLIPDFFATLHPRIKSPYILLTHNGDYSPIFFKAIDHPWQGHDFSPYLDSPKLIVWFAQNIDFQHPKLKALPLGIANNYWEHGNIGMFHNAQRSPVPLEKKLPRMYVNFSAGSNPAERNAALNQSKKMSCCDIVGRKKPARYLEETKQYRYVLSPPGNGIDCHRTWEALLVGSIPIMKRSLLDSLFDELPVIFVDDWSELTEEFLEKKYQEILSGSYKYERMYADYWIETIRSYQRG